MLKTLLYRLFGGEGNKIFKGMATLAIGSALGRLASLAAMPLLSRIYTPEHFGILSIFTALVITLAPTLTLRYVLAAPLPKRDATALNLMAVAIALLVGMTTLLLLLMLLFAEPFLSLLSMKALQPWWWLVVMATFLLALYEALTLWATRNRQYKAMARSELLQHLVGTAAKLGMGLLALKPGGLLIGQALTQSAGSIVLCRAFKNSFDKNRRFITLRRMTTIATYYKDYPSYRLVSQFLMTFALQAPLFLTAWAYDASTTGQLGLAIMALSLPVNLIGDNMAKAFYAEISSIGKKKPEKIRRITNAVLKRLGVLAIPPSLILILFGESLFVMVFGSDWRLAGQFASALAIYLVFQFLSKPVGYIMFVFNGQKKLLLINIQRTILTVACFVLGQQLDLTALSVITLYAMLLTGHYLISIFIAINMIKKES